MKFRLAFLDLVLCGKIQRERETLKVLEILVHHLVAAQYIVSRL